MLDRAEELLKSNSHNSIEKAYNSYKTLYIRSILESNKDLKIKALKGLIESSKRLNLDYQDYESELKKLQKKRKKIKSVEKKREKKDLKQYPKIEPKKEIKILKFVRLKKGSIELHFNKALKKEEVNHFSIINKKKSIYKKVFDVKSVWPYIRREYSLKTIEKLKIAQHNKRVTRIVLEDKKPIDIDFSIEKDTLKIYIKEKENSNHATHKNSTSKKTALHKNRAIKPTRFLLSKKIIVIDPGHGGKDSGAIGYKRKKEKDAVLAIAKKLYYELKKRGYRVYMTRTKDYFITLKNRTRYANRMNADLFISIHANAAPTKNKYLSMRGIETFFLSPARSNRAKKVAALENKAALSSLGYYSKLTFLDFLNREKIVASNKLAIDVQKGILYNLRKHFRGVEDGGVREAPFWVLVGAQMPSILIETGYITNPTEAKRLFNPYYQKLLAKGIADGVDSYFAKNL